MRLATVSMLAAFLVCLSSALSAQTIVAEGPVVYGHHHFNTTDMAAQKRFFVETLGGKLATIGTNKPSRRGCRLSMNAVAIVRSPARSRRPPAARARLSGVQRTSTAVSETAGSDPHLHHPAPGGRRVGGWCARGRGGR